MAHREASIAKELLSYWMENPDAQDTLEGIAEWWLLERYLRQRVAEVRRGLDELVERGFVVERRGGDARQRYRLNRDRLPAIERFLAENGVDDTPDGTRHRT